MKKSNNSWFEKVFKLSQNKTNIKTEVMAGITTFMTMAYILAVNPNILSVTGMDKGALFIATALAAIIGTVLMALFTNYPFALAPGMGLNAYFAYYVCGVLGYSWEVALAAVFVEGIIFIILTFANIREAIFNAIPQNIKFAVSAGIGLFISFIGLQNAKLIVSNEVTLVQKGDFKSLTVILAIIGIMLTAILVVKKVKGAILFGILGTYSLGVICQMVGWYVQNPKLGMLSLYPGLPSFPPNIFGEIAFKLDFSSIFSFEFFAVVFAFLFVDLFDTLGTLIGVSAKAGYLDEDGKLPNIKGALFADSVATTTGALLGTSTTTTFVESAAGVAAGGRTGLTGLTTAALFALSLFLAPVFLVIPAWATAPALIIVGFYMLDSVTKIDFTDASEAIPAFLTILIMPLSYSISEGIVAGVVSYVVINLFAGKAKKVHPIMYVLAVLFVLKYVFV